MEAWCVASYGSAYLLNERLFHSSDPYKAYACDKCGAFLNNETCPACPEGRARTLNIPYATKLLFQELMAMGVMPRIFGKATKA